MEIFTFLTTRSSYIINSVSTKASVDFIRYFLHDMTKGLINRDITSKSFLNMGKKVFGQNHSTKNVIDVQG